MSHPPTLRPPLLALHGISVRLRDVTVLRDVSLTVPEGAVVGLMGPNGAGKTTLLNVVCGLVKPRTGTMTLDGAPLRPRPHELADLGIARTLQGGGLFESMTVLENVVAGTRPPARTGLGTLLRRASAPGPDERALRDRGASVLRELGLAEHADAPVTSLPLPGRRRVALARALLRDPRLLLLDEPAGGLTADEVADLAALIARLPGRRGARRCAVLLVEHRWDLISRVCDQVVVLDSGQIIATGPPDVVREDPAVVAAYLGRT